MSFLSIEAISLSCVTSKVLHIISVQHISLTNEWINEYLLSEQIKAWKQQNVDLKERQPNGDWSMKGQGG